METRRGAPCGASWDATARVIGAHVREAPQLLGLAVQLLCKASTRDWDPVVAQNVNPIHFAGKVHMKAFAKALDLAAAGSPLEPPQSTG